MTKQQIFIEILNKREMAYNLYSKGLELGIQNKTLIDTEAVLENYIITEKSMKREKKFYLETVLEIIERIVEVLSKEIEEKLESNRHKTAISRVYASKPYRLYQELKEISKQDTILDYGCGKGYDVIEMSKNGYSIKGFDKFQDGYKDTNVLNKKYDVVTCNYVFNVIENIEERKKLLTDLKSLGKKVLISVRNDRKAIKSNWTSYKDGFITGNGTFQRFYNEQDIIEFFGKVRIIESGTQFIFSL